MAAGRPTAYKEKIATEICDRLSGGESLNRICFDAHMPAKGTVYNWLADPDRAEFLDKYMQARDRQAETFVDECLDIADATHNDTLKKTTKSGDEFEAPNHEWITRSRLRVDTRLKLAEKMCPRKYGQKASFEHTGPNGGPILTDLLSMFPESVKAKIKDEVMKKIG